MHGKIQGFVGVLWVGCVCSGQEERAGDGVSWAGECGDLPDGFRTKEIEGRAGVQGLARGGGGEGTKRVWSGGTCPCQ